MIVLAHIHGLALFNYQARAHPLVFTQSGGHYFTWLKLYETQRSLYSIEPR